MDVTMREAIRKFVVQRLLSGDARGLEDETDLYEAGVLQSLTMLELTTFLERTFSVRLRPNQITPATFRSVAAIEKLVTEARASMAARPKPV